MSSVEKKAYAKILLVMERIKSNAILGLNEDGKSHYPLKGSTLMMSDGTALSEEEQRLTIEALADNGAIEIIKRNVTLVDALIAFGKVDPLPLDYDLKVNDEQFTAIWNKYIANLGKGNAFESLNAGSTAFDAVKRQILYGDRSASIQNDSLAEVFCRLMYGSTPGTSISWDVVYEAMGENTDDANERSRRKIYDLCRRLNRLAETKLGIEQLFEWKSNSVIRKM